MINKVRSFVTKHNMLTLGDRIVVGVSGGADSICLFYMLLELSEEYKLTLFVVHVNHGIRKQEASHDEMFVEELCKNYSVPFTLVTRDVPAIAKAEGLGEEEAGRNARYEAFYNCYKENNCTKIAVAHNKNDNAETFLFNLFRGSGITGLTGIPPTRDAIIRPLLCLEREEIEEYLEQDQIPYVIDYTNLTDDYSRNKIRNNILTYAKKEINNKAIEHITSSVIMLNEIDDFIKKSVNKTYNEIVKEEKNNKEIRIELEEFNKLDIVIQKELIRKVIKKLSGRLKDIDSSHIQVVIGLTKKQVGKENHLPYDIIVIKGYNNLIFREVEKNNRQHSNYSLKPINLSIPCNMYIPEINYTIDIRVIDNEKGITFPSKTYTKWFDYDKISNSLLLRSRQEGDIIQINNKGGTKKLKDLFIDEKIPKEKRNRIPLIADGSHIVWVIGGRISEAYKISDNTKTIMEINIHGGS